MQDVYAQAVVNISADHASESTIGLLSSERQAASRKIVRLEDGMDVYVRRPLLHTDSSGISHVPAPDLDKHVLMSRAWVIQERILSPRILHFCQYEIALECDTCTMCECTIQPRSPAERRFRKALQDPLSDVYGYGTMNAWSELVGRYSASQLTFESDRLAAIAGLASRAASSWGKTYIAGLWKEELPRSLLWYS